MNELDCTQITIAVGFGKYYTIRMVYKLNRRPSKKQALLDIAAGIIGSYGFEALTIDALAKAAGVTKGGVQYHFVSKDQLIIQLLEHLLNSFDEMLEARPQGQTWLEAYVSMLLIPEQDGDRAVASILAALPPGDPRTSTYEKFSAKWDQAATDSGVEVTLAHIVRLATDALWLERTYSQKPNHDFTNIVHRLLKLIKDNQK